MGSKTHHHWLTLNSAAFFHYLILYTIFHSVLLDLVLVQFMTQQQSIQLHGADQPHFAKVTWTLVMELSGRIIAN